MTAWALDGRAVVERDQRFSIDRLLQDRKIPAYNFDVVGRAIHGRPICPWRLVQKVIADVRSQR